MSERVKLAQEIATKFHADQKYGSDPYTKHLSNVVEVLGRYEVTDEDIIVAAWLHDSVEDTDLTIEDIKTLFGDRVADLVFRVTNESGANRKERHVKTYPKIKESSDALLLKLADRIANNERSIVDNAKLLKMYRDEYPAFKDALYTKGVHEELWKHLDYLYKSYYVEK